MNQLFPFFIAFVIATATLLVAVYLLMPYEFQEFKRSCEDHNGHVVDTINKNGFDCIDFEGKIIR